MTSAHRLVFAGLLGALLLLAGAESLIGLQGLELSALGMRFRLRPPPDVPSPVTALLLRATETRQRQLPLRSQLAETLELLARLPDDQKPSAVVLDILLDSPDLPPLPGIETLPAGERIMAAAQALPLVWALETAFERENIRDEGDWRTLLAPHLLDRAPGVGHRHASGLMLANPLLAPGLYQSAAGIGQWNLLPPLELKGARRVPDPATPYRLPLWSSPDNARFVPALSLAGALRARCKGPLSECEISHNGQLTVGPGGPRIPLVEQGDLWLNLRKRFDVHAETSRRAMKGRPPELVQAQLLTDTIGADTHLELTDGNGDALEPGALAGQVLLIADHLEPMTVLSPLGLGHAPWSLHAQAMSNMLENDFLKVLPRGADFGLAALGLGLTLGLRWASRRRDEQDVEAESTAPSIPPSRWHRVLERPELPLGVGWSAASIVSLSLASVWLPLVIPLLTWTGSAIGWSVMDVWLLRRALIDQRALVDSMEKARATAVSLEQEAKSELAKEKDGQAILREVQEKETTSQALEEVEIHARRKAEQAQEAVAAPNLSAKALAEAQARATRAEEDLLAAQKAAELARAEATEAQSKLSSEARALDKTAEALEQIWMTLERELMDPLRQRGKAFELKGEASNLPSAWKARLETLEQYLAEVQRSSSRITPAEQKSLGQQRNRIAAIGKGMSGIQGMLLELVKPLLTDPEAAHTEDSHQGAEGVPFPEWKAFLSEFFCHDPRLLRQLRELPLIARSPHPVLILGPSGSGKEIIARWLWKLRGANSAYVPVNCAGISPGLMEDELFGHVKNYLNDAKEARAGLFRKAEGGTIFLDELGVMPIAQQAAMRRAIDPGRIRPLGSDVEEPVNVHVIAATSAPLDQWARDGRFDNDLYRRFADTIALPGLQEQQEDIPALATKFLNKWKGEHSGRPDLKLSFEARMVLQAYDWPGNTRELKLKVETMAERCTGGTIDAALALKVLGIKPTQKKTEVSFLGPEEQKRLSFLRVHHFDVKSVSQSPQAWGEDSTIDTHLLLMLARTLKAYDWSVANTLTFLAGDDPAGRQALKRRIDDYIFGVLREDGKEDSGKKASKSRRDEKNEAGPDLRTRLETRFRKKNAEVMWEVVEALRAGKLKEG